MHESIEVRLSFGQWVKHQRRLYDMTQDQLAALIGCSRITVRRLENDESRPAPDLVKRIAREFQIPAEEHSSLVLWARRTPGSVEAAPSLPPPERSERISAQPVHPRTPLLGREELAAAVLDRLRDRRHRSVTLAGPAGIGKTRLALQIAEQARSIFPDGVWFVDLSALRHGDEIVRAIFSAIGELQHAAPGIQALGAQFNQRQVLLVLDNLEQIRDAAPALSALLDGVPGLTVLLTSRMRVKLYGELVIEVPPLPTPPEDSPPGAIESSPAVRLFRQRMEAHVGDGGGETDGPLIAHLCRQMEGLPLAIELAAALTSALPLPALASQLDSRMIYSAVGASDHPDRQRTMEGALDWSYGLLSDEDQAALRALGVFQSGWSLAAAAYVWDDTEDDLPVSLSAWESWRQEMSRRALGRIQRLKERSLVVADSQDCERPRYRLYMVIQEFARDRLREQPNCHALHTRHARFYLAWLEQAVEGMQRQHHQRWLDAIERELPNCDTALRWWDDQGDFEQLGRMISAMAFYWAVRHMAAQAQVWLRRIQPHLEGLSPLTGAQISWRIALFLGTPETSADLLEQSAALFRDLGHSSGMSMVYNLIGLTAMSEGRYEESTRYLNEAMVLAQADGNISAYHNAVNNLGMGIIQQGRYREAQQHFVEVYHLCRAAGNLWIASCAAHNLGESYLMSGDPDSGRLWFQVVIDLAASVGDLRSVFDSNHVLGLIALYRHEYDLAREHLLCALKMAPRLASLSGLCLLVEALAAALSGTIPDESVVELLAIADTHHFNTIWWVYPAEWYRFFHAPLVARLQADLGATAYRMAWLRGQFVREADVIERVRQLAGA